MVNIKKIEDEDLLHQLSGAFKDYGYEGTSITILSKVTGLKRPSLYHRFPRGKEQMAEEVLSFIYTWIEENILNKLKENLTPEEKINFFVHQIGKIYENGKNSCILNMLSATKCENNPFSEAINNTFKTLQVALSDIAVQAGNDRKEAQNRAENILVEIQGALVLSRAMNSTAPFKRMQKRLPDILLSR